ncbi:MAG: FKBP-type peptidyl-prolyl cis-trans isomerase [Lachnospiraceae bacterium]|nr:FKBP-type peptidyl-prolyl cis-trans isomerase [Lachnospiraceae bacterium]
MAGKKDNRYEGMSASKAKRERAKDEREALKRSAKRTRAILIAIPVLIIALIAGYYGRQVYIEKNKTVASTDYSAMLNDDGSIKDVDVTQYVKTFDVNDVKIAKSDVEFTDEDMEENIKTQLETYKELSTDAELTVADGDEVNIDYVGTMDGEEFEGGSAQAYDLTIGSNSFIDDFETQLVGSHPGDQVTVDVTFPDPYENNPDYAGKDASFAVTVNGIYQLGEFNNDFVKKNLSQYGKTVEEYKAEIKKTNEESNLAAAVNNYVNDHISADSYPKDYLKHLKSLQMTMDQQEFDYMAQMYAAYGMTFDYADVMAYKQASSTEEYEKMLTEAAQKTCLTNMAYQELAAQAGITVTDEDYDAFLEENSVTEENQESFGRAYLIQNYILPEKVRDYLAEHATVE